MESIEGGLRIRKRLATEVWHPSLTLAHMKGTQTPYAPQQLLARWYVECDCCRTIRSIAYKS